MLDPDGNPLPPPLDTLVLDIQGQVMTFGPSYDGARQVGTCSAPLNYTDATDLQRLQSYSIADGAPTVFWLTDGGKGSNRHDYYLTVQRDPDATNPAIGEDSMRALIELYEVTGCPFTPVDPISRGTLTLHLDPNLDQTFVVDGSIPGEDIAKNPETTAGLWQVQDASSHAIFDDHPFTGEGWESNYDSGGVVVDSTFQANLDAEVRDQYCADNKAYSTNSRDTGVLDPASCDAAYFSKVRPAEDTIFDSQDRHALDLGDVIPFHWTLDHQGLFLNRLAPNRQDSSQPDFRGASYFADAPASATITGFVDTPLPLPLLSSNQRPLLALDQSPLARAINDMRCWYLGTRGKGTNKCKAENPVVDVGWEELACQYDSRFGCRKPYMILISDGEDNIGGENPTADVSDLFGASGMRTWVINLGDPDNCRNGLLHAIVNAGGQGQGRTGDCINVSNGSQLRQELESILGQIRTEVRAFASAAVPTVQATVEQKIFLTNFTPFNDSGVWDGHVQSFIKPLPTDNGKPDTTKTCGDSVGPRQRSHDSARAARHRVLPVGRRCQPAAAPVRRGRRFGRRLAPGADHRHRRERLQPAPGVLRRAGPGTGRVGGEPAPVPGAGADHATTAASASTCGTPWASATRCPRRTDDDQHGAPGRRDRGHQLRAAQEAGHGGRPGDRRRRRSYPSCSATPSTPRRR